MSCFVLSCLYNGLLLWLLPWLLSCLLSAIPLGHFSAMLLLIDLKSSQNELIVYLAAFPLKALKSISPNCLRTSRFLYIPDFDNPVWSSKVITGTVNHFFQPLLLSICMRAYQSAICPEESRSLSSKSLNPFISVI